MGWRILIAVLMLTSVYADRVIVTFFNASLNEQTVVPDNITTVKRYGRRLVVEGDGNWLLTFFSEDAVQRIEPDLLAVSSIVPLNSWNLNESEPYGLHIRSLRRQTNGTGTVALLDTGVFARETFDPVMGYDFVTADPGSRNPDYTDPGCNGQGWHGTKVASVLRAIAPGSELVVLRVLDGCGTGFASDVADAVVWASGGRINGLETNTMPAAVISMSFAGEGVCPSYLQSAVAQAIGLGSVVLAAAGNAAQNASLFFPGNCLGVLTLGASTRSGALATYSNWGNSLSFSAPGGDVTNPIPVLTVGEDGSLVYDVAVGTSLAVPHVAGMYSLLLGIGIRVQSALEYFPLVLNESCGRMGVIGGNSTSNGTYVETFAEFYVHEASLFCSAGTYLANTWDSVCTPCDSNSYSSPGATSCSCNVGYSAGYSGVLCVICPGGYFCPGGMTKGVCTPGQFSSSGMTACGICSLGTITVQYRATACFNCYSGSYTSTSASQACIDCASGKYTSTTKSTVCNLCSPGTYSTLQIYVGSTYCLLCAAGTFNLASAASVCTDCNIGFYSTQGTGTLCSACTVGTYVSSTAAAFCSPCNAGFYTTAMASTVCINCPAGSYSGSGMNYCSQCGPGTYSISGVGCGQCPAGTYSKTPAAVCLECPKGFYSTTLGMTDGSDCKSCLPGKYGNSVSAVGCLPCDPGTSINTRGAVDACGACPENYFASSYGMITCSMCSTLTLKCDAGFQMIPCTTTTDAYCSPCQQYANCVYVTANGCFKADGITPSCMCMAGYERSGSTCQACTNGKFKSTVNNDPCQPWTVSSCLDGQYIASGTAYNDALCIPCPLPPPNAVSTVLQCGWACNAGFDNNI